MLGAAALSAALRSFEHRLLFRLGTLGIVVDPPQLQIAQTVSAITPFLLLHAFANGTTALTGVEAISNGITAFKEPRSHNAGITLIWMSIILGSLFLGISSSSGKSHRKHIHDMLTRKRDNNFG